LLRQQISKTYGMFKRLAQWQTCLPGCHSRRNNNARDGAGIVGSKSAERPETQGWPAMQRKTFSGGNMRPRLSRQARNPASVYIPTFQETAMTQKQRLIYSILIALSVLAIMLGLSWLQNAGMITEKTFQYVAIGVAVVVVVINGVMRRKVKP